MIARESFEVRVEVGRTDFKLTREKREEGVVSEEIQDPLIVLDERARFDDAGRQNSVRRRQRFVFERQHIAVEQRIARRRGGRPWDPART